MRTAAETSSFALLAWMQKLCAQWRRAQFHILRHECHHLVRQYAGADFCLQPPGDTLPRPGVMDAISVGCVPVLFHPMQQTLWPKHWNATGSSLLFYTR